MIPKDLRIGQTEPTPDCDVCGQAKETIEIVGKCLVCEGNICKACASLGLAKHCRLCDTLTCTIHTDDDKCLFCILLDHESFKAECETLLIKKQDEHKKEMDELGYQIEKTSENIIDMAGKIARARE
jgi:hypothetical protein